VHRPPDLTAWASQPEDEPETLVDWINNAHKVVISRTLTDSQWDNVEVARGDIVESVDKLKAQSGGDLIAYGGVGLVSSLVANDLLDDLYLFVNPVAIGDGRPVFGDLDSHRRFRLVGAQPFGCGIVALHYQPNGS
jgi:dihydrofolate reductase